MEAAESVDAKIVLGEDIGKLYEVIVNNEEMVGKDFSIVYKWLGGDD